MTTIRDVASYLGVSVSTVSRYLNNHPDLNEETRRKIEQAIRELDYVPSSAARNVSRLSTRTVGLTIPDIQDSYFSDNAYGVEQYLQENGYTLIYGSINRSPKNLTCVSGYSTGYICRYNGNIERIYCIYYFTCDGYA